MTPGLEQEIVNQAAYDKNVEHLHSAGLALPLIAELADPVTHLADKTSAPGDANPDEPILATCFACTGTMALIAARW